MTSRRGRIAAVAATLLPILAATLGLPGSFNADGTPMSIPSLCLLCGERGAADFLLNIALFAPFGAALRLAGRRTGTVALAAFALSGLIEVAQLGIPGRYTTLGDLTANTLGGLLGALLAGPGPLSLRAPASLRRQATLTALVAAVWLGSAASFTPSLPATAYYGQWTAELGHYQPYRGRVLEATIGSIPAPSWRLPPEARARAALLDGDTVTVTALAGPPPPGPAPIFSIYDHRQKEILFLGADGHDLVLKLRRRAADLRLGSPELRWEDGLAGITAGDTLRLAAWRHGRAGMCARIGAETRCDTPAVARGWVLLAPTGMVPPAARPVMDALWLGGTAAVALAWAPGAAAGVVGAGVLVLVLGIAGLVT